MAFKRLKLAALAAVIWTGLVAQPARAEQNEVRLAISLGFGFFPIYVAMDQKLIEKHAAAAGLGPVTVSVAKLSGGAAQNDALLAGSVDLVSSGVPPFLLLWDKTRGRGDVKALCATGSSPLFLNTRNPAVKTIKDFTDQDRIALAAPKIGPHAIVLQMAAAQAFGLEEWARLDKLTVALAQPDAMAALLSGRTEITSHFTVPPFQYLELEQPGIHKVLSSYDVLGGRSTFQMAWVTTKFRTENPRLTRAIYEALAEAALFIDANHKEAAEQYLRVTKENTPPEKIAAMLDDPDNKITLAPENVMKQLDFMVRTGVVKSKPESWKDLFFPEAHGLPGS